MSRHEARPEAAGLQAALERTTRSALASGALKPVETEQLLVEDAGVGFLVRVVSSLRRKEADRHARAVRGAVQDRPANPFLPPEPELTVADLGPAHVAVLNKFNVLDNHLLVVTRSFEHQETLLTPADFSALFACMSEIQGLAFYNGGTMAGASQTHKHLQLVPLPLVAHGPAVPMEALLRGEGTDCAGVPFAHAFARLSAAIPSEPLAAAEQAYGLYLDLLTQLGGKVSGGKAGPRQPFPYNLLIADGWMLIVPRVAELYRGISVNALGFAGSLFVKDRRQLELVRAAGPMQVLTAVAGRSQG